MTKHERKEKIEYLRAYRWLLIDIASEEEDLERITDRLYSVRVPVLSDMPRGGRPRTVDDNVADKVDLERTIKTDTRRSEEKQREIENAIESMSEIRDRTILKLKFIKGFTHEEIAEVINYSVTQEREFYKRALDHFEIPTTSPTHSDY